MEFRNSNRLLAKNRIDIALKVKGFYHFDRARIIRRAVVLRGETFAQMIDVLWQAARAASQRLFWPREGGHDAELTELGVTQDQVSSLVARGIAAPRDIANCTRHECGSINPASKAPV